MALNKSPLIYLVFIRGFSSVKEIGTTVSDGILSDTRFSSSSMNSLIQKLFSVVVGMKTAGTQMLRQEENS